MPQCIGHNRGDLGLNQPARAGNSIIQGCIPAPESFPLIKINLFQELSFVKNFRLILPFYCLFPLQGFNNLKR